MIGSLIAAACVSAGSPAAYQACTKTFEAVSIQYGIERDVSTFAKKTERRLLERTSREVAFGFAALYTLGIKQEVRIGIGNASNAQSTALVFKPSEIQIVLSWSL